MFSKIIHNNKIIIHKLKTLNTWIEGKTSDTQQIFSLIEIRRNETFLLFCGRDTDSITKEVKMYLLQILFLNYCSSNTTEIANTLKIFHVWYYTALMKYFVCRVLLLTCFSIQFILYCNGIDFKNFGVDITSSSPHFNRLSIYKLQSIRVESMWFFSQLKPRMRLK